MAIELAKEEHDEFIEAYEKEEAKTAAHDLDIMGFTMFINGSDKVGNAAAWLARLGYKFQCEADPDRIAEWRITFVAGMLDIADSLRDVIRLNDIDVMVSRPQAS